MKKTLYLSILLAIAAKAFGQSPSVTQNYVMETTVKVSGKTTLASLAGLPVGQANRTIQYFDGLGRPLQTVTWQGSPTGKDLVQVFEYDALGREAKKYLPYAEQTSADGGYKSSGFTNQSNYYRALPTGWDAHAVKTDYPFSITKFEASPLNRVERQGFAGEAWQPGTVGTEHTARLSYGTNNSDSNYGTTGFAVRLFSATGGSLSSSGLYGAGQLYLTISKDENWQASDGKRGTMEEYKDKEGRVVLKRMFNEKGGNTEVLSTYYVYDVFGNLGFVLPPGANPDAGVPNATLLEQFCYQYHYDGLKRLIEKKIPGKGWEYLVYNKLGQVVLTQDALQRSKEEWIFTKYDAFGRAAITGVLSSSEDRIYWESVVEAQVQLWEDRESNGGTDYTNNTIPLTNISRLFTISYYDDYHFRGMYSALPPSVAVSDMTKGLATGTRTFRDDGTASEWTMLYYDDYGRIRETVTTHHLGGTDRVLNSYSFDGLLENSVRTHVNGIGTTSIVTSHSYDHIGRKKTTSQSINGVAPTILSEMVYNEIGQLSAKRLADGLQTTTYAYNDRGWLKNSSSSQFSMTLLYNDGTYPQYNGNIAGQSYANNGNNTFDYYYDRLNRLINSTAGNNLSEAVSYDRMGNISTLTRDGFGTNTYNIYTGNQLNNISGFTNSSYTYDANGNLKTDTQKGITNISYNHLNLPQTITAPITVVYSYDGTGKKLKKVSTGSISNTTDYVDGIQYTNNTIDFIQNAEGIAFNSGGNYTYRYNLSDHLGNVRTTFKTNGSTIEVLQRDDYYAFGLRKSADNGIGAVSLDNKYLYNGKELQEELGQYDFGARLYDPVIGRWNVVDPLAELGRRWSPYVYALNNPSRFIDPDGMWVVDGSGNLSTSDADEIADFINNAKAKNKKDEEKEEQNTGNWRPLYKSTLLEYVRETQCKDCGTGTLQNKTGAFFEKLFEEFIDENFALDDFRVVRNFEKYLGFDSYTVPDYLGMSYSVGKKTGAKVSSFYELENFYELKATKNNLGAGSFGGQLKIQIQAAKRAKVSEIIIVTTYGVKMTASLINYAKQNGVLITQYWAQYQMVGGQMKTSYVPQK